jgi:hypothetical protein
VVNARTETSGSTSPRVLHQRKELAADVAVAAPVPLGSERGGEQVSEPVGLGVHDQPAVVRVHDGHGTAGPGHADHLVEDRARVAQVLEQETRVAGLDAVVLQGEPDGGPETKLDREPRVRQPIARHLQKRRVDVHTDDRAPGWQQLARDPLGEEPRTAAHIKKQTVRGKAGVPEEPVFDLANELNLNSQTLQFGDRVQRFHAVAGGAARLDGAIWLQGRPPSP